MLICLAWVYLMTFIVFPGVSCNVALKFLDGNKQALSWGNLIFSTTFNVFDTIGRKLGGVPKLGLGCTGTKILSYSRVIFFSFFLTACHVGPEHLFYSTWFSLLNMALFAVTNGYCGTLSAIKSTQ